VFIEARTSFAVSGTYYTPMLQSLVWGQERLGFLCSWRDYSTELYADACSFWIKTDAPRIGSNVSRIYTDQLSGYGRRLTIFSGPVNSGFYSVSPSIYFTYLLARGSSRGVGEGNWASFDCGPY